jgi:hypothetical protein
MTSKYKNVKTAVDGVTFDSGAEARRYGELKLLERAGAIENLTLQPKFDCVVDGTKVCTYRADFSYFTRTPSGLGEKRVVEDVKGYKTPVYKLKKRLVEAIYRGVTITEITNG